MLSEVSRAPFILFTKWPLMPTFVTDDFIVINIFCKKVPNTAFRWWHGGLIITLSLHVIACLDHNAMRLRGPMIPVISLSFAMLMLLKSNVLFHRLWFYYVRLCYKHSLDDTSIFIMQLRLCLSTLTHASIDMVRSTVYRGIVDRISELGIPSQQLVLFLIILLLVCMAWNSTTAR